VSTINDGGPAFPQNVPAGVIGGGCGPHVEWGMSLRAYFAGQAMVGLIASNADISTMNAAHWAVAHADALIAELSKPEAAK
jgi:hypothetical protein